MSQPIKDKIILFLYNNALWLAVAVVAIILLTLVFFYFYNRKNFNKNKGIDSPLLNSIKDETTPSLNNKEKQ